MVANRRILVIDDNREIHEDIRRILGDDEQESVADELDFLTAEILGEKQVRKTHETFELDFATQGEEGLTMTQQALAEGRPYAVAFVDVRMPPGWDGVETIAHLWNLDKRLQAVVITAFADYDWSQIVEKLGSTDRLLILKKPFENIEIRQLATALCEKWRLSQEMIEANTALRVSEERYADLYDNSPDMYVSVMADTGLIRRSNQTTARKLGYTKDEIIGKHIFELYHPDCLEDVKQAFQSFVETGEVENAELQLMRKDGSKLDVNLNVTSVRDEEGKVLYSRSCWIDISERKKAEKLLEKVSSYLQSLIDAMPSIIIGIDTGSRVTHLNEMGSRLFKMTADEAIGKDLGELYPPVFEELKQALKVVSAEHHYRREKLSYQLGDEFRIADVVIYPVGDEEEMQLVIRLDDVTERVRMQELLSQTEKMMSVGGLAAGMAHEINNPLGGMLQGIQNIQRRFSPDIKANVETAENLGVDLEQIHAYMEQRQIKHFMDEMAQAGKRASDIVKNMLQFSRKKDSVKVTEDINELIDKTISLAEIDYDLNKSYDFRQVEIYREFAPELPQIPCIASEIQQVLLNIMRNAAQALTSSEQERTPCISVRTYQVKGRVCIEIQDNGPGIDEGIKPRVFEPFFTTRPIGEGTGLGLSVSYFIIHEEHGGELSVESVPGSGTKFIIELPLE